MLFFFTSAAVKQYWQKAKVHSAVVVCKAKTGLNHFSILISSAPETIMADLLFHHCLLSPLLYTTIPCLLLSATVLYITYFYPQLLHDYIFTHNPPTPQIHTHSYLLFCAYLRFWFGFGQGMFALFLVLSSQYRKRAAWLITVCEMCLYGEKRKKEISRGGDVEIARFYYIDRTSCWDMWCFSLCFWQRGSMIPLCCLRMKEVKHSFIHSSPFHLFSI